VIASDTSESASRIATQEMSLATYRILSEPAQTDAPGRKEEGSQMTMSPAPGRKGGCPETIHRRNSARSENNEQKY
jgi:hypothetical protein